MTGTEDTSQPKRIAQDIAIVGLLALGGLLMLNTISSEAVSQVSMEERGEIINVDVNDSKAVTQWAHGFCRGQTLEHLASLYEVTPTMEAVTAAVSGGLPSPARRIVVEVCEAELLQEDEAT